MPRRKVNVDKRIKAALQEKTLTWSQLEEKTGVSKGALSKHLNRLIKYGIVLTKTRDTRPPVTEYYLADETTRIIVTFLLKNIPEKEVTYFLENFNDKKIFEVFSQSLTKLLTNYFEKGQENKKSLTLDFNSVLHSIGLSSQNAEKQLIKAKFHMPLAEYFQVDPNNKKELERNTLKEVYSETSMQLFLTIYDLEKNFWDTITPEFREKLMRRGNLEFFTVSPILQEHNLWSKVDDLFKWWKKKVMPHIPSVILISILAMELFHLRLYVSGTSFSQVETEK